MSKEQLDSVVNIVKKIKSRNKVTMTALEDLTNIVYDYYQRLEQAKEYANIMSRRIPMTELINILEGVRNE